MKNQRQLPHPPTRGRLVPLAAVAASLMVVGVLAGVSSGAHRSASPGGGMDAPTAAGAFGHLPLRFEANEGQSGPDAGFLVRSEGFTAFVTGPDTVFRLGNGTAGQVRMHLAGGDAGASATTGRRLPGVSNYLRGAGEKAWLTGVPSYDQVRYDAVYPGIDLVYHGKHRVLEYDFEVAPGADPARIAVAIDGATDVAIDDAGDLVIDTPAGNLRHRRPVAYQDTGGVRRPVEAAYTKGSDGRIGFRLGRYDRSQLLVIDPAVVYSTLLGGLNADSAAGVATDAAGNTYLTGQTASPDFPAVTPLQAGRRGASDAFVTKLNSSGTALVYSTYLGGDGIDAGTAIAVDGSLNTYVTGSTASTNFPTASPVQATKGAGVTTDVFLAKLSPSGSALVYSTYLGGNQSEVGRGIAVDAAGGAYVTGDTASTDFPVATAFQGAKGAGATTDAFVTKFNPAGSALAYSTYLGGALADIGRAIAVDGAGNAHVTGETSSANFPVAAALRGTPAGATDAFVTKLNPAGSALLYSTYLGGGEADAGNGIGLDAASNAYVAGVTGSDDFPLTAGALQTTRAGGGEAFVTKLDPAGSGPLYSTLLGGSGPDQANAVAVEPGGSAHVAGTTSSVDFPVATPVSSRGGSSDAFLAQLTPAGSALVHGAPFGGSAADSGAAVALDPAGNAYLAGQSSFFNTDDFPTVNGFEAPPGQENNAFVVKVAPLTAGTPLVTALAPRSGPPGTSISIHGAGFTNASGVRFGTVAASAFTLVSQTEIRAVAPASAAAVATVTVTTPGGTSPPNPVARYTYAEGTWEVTGAQVVARVATRSVLLANGKVLLVGGRDRQGGAALTSAEVYDPKTGTWSATGSMSAARSAHTATLLPNGKVLVTGGSTGGNTSANAVPQLDSAELYDPGTGTFTPTGTMSVRRYLHTAILLKNGKVLVAGGRTCNVAPPGTCDFTQYTNTADLYDPATGTFTPTGAMSVPRHTTDSTMLADGRVLVPAGFGGPGSGWDSADVYDPESGTWKATGPLTVGRSRQGAVTLANGKALIASGFSGIATAELYDPATNEWKLTGGPNSTSRTNHFFGMLANGRALLAGGGVGGTSAEVYDQDTGKWRSAGTLNISRGIAGTPYNTVKPVVLSSDPNRLELDPAVCGNNCGKVLLAGESEDRRAELYTPAGTSTDKGYWLVASDGGVFAYGRAGFHGSTGAIRLNSPVVGMAGTPSGKGYWLVAADGGVFAFGDARFVGSTGALKLNRPIVGMAATLSGRGYWLVASDGGVFAFGDAAFLGSTGALTLNQPVVGMAANPKGRGYWLVAADGGIFAFGDAVFRGSTGAIRLNRPVVGMTATPSGKGYALVASDGGIFAFGDAVFRGSTGALRLNQPVVGMAPTPSIGVLNGYWLVASDGGVFAFGDAHFLGSTGAIRLNRPMVGMATAPFG